MTTNELKESSKGWSAERRAAQSARMHARKPWLNSTGPRSHAGKRASHLNATKHGHRSAKMRELSHLLRMQQLFISRWRGGRYHPPKRRLKMTWNFLHFLRPLRHSAINTIFSTLQQLGRRLFLQAFEPPDLLCLSRRNFVKPRFSLALVPDDPNLSQLMTDFAQRRFKSRSKDYLLDEFALPHVTVCQFRADDERHAQQIADAWYSGLTPERFVTFDEVYFRPKPDIGAGFYNVGLLVKNTEALVNMQQQACDLITSMGGEPLTKSGADYWPHSTLAYVDGKDFAISSSEIDHWAFGKKAVHPVVGLNDEAGQLKKIISAAPQTVPPPANLPKPSQYNP